MSERHLRLAPSQSLASHLTLSPPPEGGLKAVIIDSSRLLQGQQEVTIAHQGHHYRLRVTSLGKLILTK